MTTNCDYLYATCDTKSTNSINNLIFTYTPKNTDTYIICGNANRLDLIVLLIELLLHIVEMMTFLKMLLIILNLIHLLAF